MKNDARRPSQVTPLKAVAVVAHNPDPALLDSVLDAGDYDVVFVESMDRAYSCIKKTAPDLVIVCVTIDDVRSFQLLSMLSLDPDTAKIPICTCVDVPQLAGDDHLGVPSFHRASVGMRVAMLN